MESQSVPVTVKQTSSKSDKCRLAEIMQYDCEPLPAGGFNCLPLIRIFRLCPGRPAVELTRFVNFDPSTGAVEIPSSSSENIKGKPWRDVIRHKPKVSET